jgi:5-methylthioribose kinase
VFHGRVDAGFDVGLLVGNLLLGFFSQAGHADKEGQSNAGGREAYKLWLLDTIRELWRHFVRRFTALWEADRGDSDHEVCPALRTRTRTRGGED